MAIEANASDCRDEVPGIGLASLNRLFCGVGHQQCESEGTVAC